MMKQNRNLPAIADSGKSAVTTFAFVDHFFLMSSLIGGLVYPRLIIICNLLYRPVLFFFHDRILSCGRRRLDERDVEGFIATTDNILELVGYAAFTVCCAAGFKVTVAFFLWPAFISYWYGTSEES